MTISMSFFYFFSFLVLAFSSLVIFSKNPVTIALYLVATFVAMAGLWLLLKAEFLAFILILVYVGAVMTLFLFVVMMLTHPHMEENKFNNPFLILQLVIVLLLGFLVTLIAWSYHPIISYQTPPATDLQSLGILLYTKYSYAVEIAGALLLVAIITAIGLSWSFHFKSLGENPAQQIKASKENRLKIIKNLGRNNI